MRSSATDVATRRPRSALSVLVSTASLLAATHGLADAPSKSDDATRLFEQGRQSLERGDVAAACDLLAQSYALRPGHGTLLNLAVCLERKGALVEAYQQFQAALTAAVADHRADRERLAREHLEGLTAKLSFIKLHWPSEHAGMVVSFDDKTVAKGVESLVVAAGPHRITATAPGREPFELTIAAIGGRDVVIQLPTLEPVASTPVQPRHEQVRPAPPPHKAAPAPLQPAPTRAGDSPEKPSVVLPVSTLAVGGAALLAGSVLGLRVISDANEVKRVCPDRRCTTDESLNRAGELNERAARDARLADVFVPLGLVLSGVGAVWLWSSSNQPVASERRAAKLAVVAAPGMASAALTGVW